jgi:serine/threonine protein phosphatase PrpC
MSDDNEANISFSTRLDKAHLPEESARIKSLGGVIRYPQNKTHLSRVWVYSTTARETIGLAMSRSIGDWEWGAVGVIAEPLVDVIDLGPKVSKTFLLAASDGMWDMRLRPQFFANRFGQDLFTEKTHPLRLCYEVIEAISPRNSTFYRDDITIVFMML